MTVLPKSDRPGFFADEMTERVFATVVALAAEVSLLRERVATLEAKAGLKAAEDPARAAETFVADVFGALAQPLPRV